MPEGVASYVAAQLGVDAASLALYSERITTHNEHAAMIRRTFGYENFGDGPHHFRLLRWLYERAWLSAERPSVLFDLATAWLVERKVLFGTHGARAARDEGACQWSSKNVGVWSLKNVGYERSFGLSQSLPARPHLPRSP